MPPLRVFLSSTALDLEAYRLKADDTLLRLQQRSVAMERFGPLPGAPVAECERLAAECDALICIVAHRHGYEPDAGRGSITRREVEAARAAGKPVYAWIVDDRHPWPGVKEQDRLAQPDVLGDADKTAEVLAALKALQDFKAWLRQTVVIDSFTTSENLGEKIAILVGQLATQRAASAAGAPASAAAGCTRPPELRIVHPLQPAPHFHGRERLVEQLSTWVDDTASPDRLHALVAAGGTGKTAIAEQVVAKLRERWPPPGAGSVLVWSFYERPEADAFLRECGQLFLGEPDDAPPGGRLERLQRGLRDGRPHLIVLDGMERVQAEAGHGRVRGELEDHTLKLLLQAIAAGLGRTRALVTSRFPLTDLRDWQRRGVVETPLDDLPADAARAVLRGWGVAGSDAQLDAVAAQVGRHALSVAVIGSYLWHFESGRIEAAANIRLDDVAGDDPKAAKLARVLGFYAERLPAEERDLLARLAVFPRGITLDVLGMLVDAGGEVAGVLVNAAPALPRLLQRLVDRGLVFRYPAVDRTLTWTAHPFVRDRFAGLLGCPAEGVFNAVALRLGHGLEQRPANKPTETAVLDRYEQLIEMTRLAGRAEKAFNLFRDGMGGYKHLGLKLGEYARGQSILRGFLPPDGAPERFGEGMPALLQSVALNELAWGEGRLGRLLEALELRREDDGRKRLLDDPARTSIGLQNTSELTYDLGRLGDAQAHADQALAEAVRADDPSHKEGSLTHRARARHRRGNIAAAEADFAAAVALGSARLLYSARGQRHARHHIDLGRRRPRNRRRRPADRAELRCELRSSRLALLACPPRGHRRHRPDRAPRRDPRLDFPHRRHGADDRGPRARGPRRAGPRRPAHSQGRSRRWPAPRPPLRLPPAGDRRPGHPLGDPPGLARRRRGAGRCPPGAGLGHCARMRRRLGRGRRGARLGPGLRRARPTRPRAPCLHPGARGARAHPPPAGAGHARRTGTAASLSP